VIGQLTGFWGCQLIICDPGQNLNFVPNGGTTLLFNRGAYTSKGFSAGVRTATTATLYTDAGQVAQNPSQGAASSFQSENFMILAGSQPAYSIGTEGFTAMFSALTTTEVMAVRDAVYAALHALNPTAYP